MQRRRANWLRKLGPGVTEPASATFARSKLCSQWKWSLLGHTLYPDRLWGPEPGRTYRPSFISMNIRTVT